jgi:hypothetical protein
MGVLRNPWNHCSSGINPNESNRKMKQDQQVAAAAHTVKNLFSTAEPPPPSTALQPPKNPLLREPASTATLHLL